MSVELPPYRPIPNRSGLKVMGAALHALFMRELQTRFGGYRLGYLWAPLEAIFHIMVYIILFGVFLQRAVPSMDYSLFLVAGLIPFTMLRKIGIKSLTAVDSNRGLLVYSAVRHIDIIIARSFLELVIYFFTFIFLLFGLAFFDIAISLSHLDIVLLCWITIFLFSLGLGLIMMVIGFYGGEISKIIVVIFTILYFASGVIYPIRIIPQPYFDYLLYNPLIHNLELMRYAVAPSYPTRHIDFRYFLEWMAIVVFLGLLLYKFAERDMIRSK